jgi:hypothetical protein
VESKVYSDSRGVDGQPSGHLRIGFFAAASVLFGGLMAAWWYRNTLKNIHHAVENPSNPHFGIPEDDPPDEA